MSLIRMFGAAAAVVIACSMIAPAHADGAPIGSAPDLTFASTDCQTTQVTVANLDPSQYYTFDVTDPVGHEPVIAAFEHASGVTSHTWPVTICPGTAFGSGNELQQGAWRIVEYSRASNFAPDVVGRFAVNYPSFSVMRKKKSKEAVARLTFQGRPLRRAKVALQQYDYDNQVWFNVQHFKLNKKGKVFMTCARGCHNTVRLAYGSFSGSADFELPRARTASLTPLKAVVARLG